MSERRRAFVGLGSNLGDRRRGLEEALGRLDALSGTRLAAASDAFENPPVGGPPQADYWNAVAELSTVLSAPDLLRAMHRIEADAGRVRGEERDAPRVLDLDLLAIGDDVAHGGDAVLPHPRSLDRAFVLGPWAEIAPEHVVAGTGACVLELATRLRAREPAAFRVLRRVANLVPVPPTASRPRRPVVLEDRGALDVLRRDAEGRVGFVPTLGALHEGHASHARRAVATTDVTIASVFVNPLQFGPDEDFTRYPRTFDADLDLLGREGVHAVYAPSRDDLYPEGFSTSVEVAGVTERFEGALRPGHFRGVATVVAKLLARVRPDRTFFGRKDAQQVALVRRLARDLDLPGEIVVGPTVRDPDGLALSSRNRRLSAEERARALALPRALAAARDAAAAGTVEAAALVETARRVLADSGLVADYLDVVDSDSFAPRASVAASAGLLVGAVRVGATRILDNEWLLGPRAVGGIV